LLAFAGLEFRGDIERELQHRDPGVIASPAKSSSDSNEFELVVVSHQFAGSGDDVVRVCSSWLH
jgi:uncharacterized lipoprotein YmbA